MYGETLKLLQRESIKQLWDREWVSRVSGKQAGYNGLAEYHQSRVSLNPHPLSLLLLGSSREGGKHNWNGRDGGREWGKREGRREGIGNVISKMEYILLVSRIFYLSTYLYNCFRFATMTSRWEKRLRVSIKPLSYSNRLKLGLGTWPCLPTILAERRTAWTKQLRTTTSSTTRGFLTWVPEKDFLWGYVHVDAPQFGILPEVVPELQIV